jgi:hypothetical protein
MGIVPNLGRTGDGGMPPESGEMTGAGVMGATTSKEELGARFRVIRVATLKVVATLTPDTRIIRDGRTATETVR